MKPLLLGNPLQLADVEELNAPTPPLGRVLKIAAYAVAGFVALFLLWGFTAPLSKAAIAPGVVQVEGRRRVIQHLEGGIVAEILVRENMRVRKGQPLMRLDTVQSSAAAEAARSEYLTLAAEEQRLKAELSGVGTFELPEELRGTPSARVVEIMENQRSLLSSRRESLSGQMQVLQATASQARAEIGGLEPQIASQRAQLALLRGELATVQQLVDEQLERRSRLLELQRAVATVEGQIGSLTGQVMRARSMMSESHARMSSLASDRRDETVQALRDVQLKLSETREKLRATTDVNARRTIVSPVDGQIVQLRFNSVGGVVGPGQPIMDVAPTRQQFQITARVRPIDIENVVVGLPTEVRLLPYRGRKIPLLMGHVTAVSQDAITPEKAGEPPFYQIEVQIDDTAEVSRLNLKLLSGMPAEIYVVLGDRSLFAYLFQPLADSFRRSFREN